jgi:Zn-dependent peptidase ImmA (M78 family)
MKVSYSKREHIGRLLRDHGTTQPPVPVEAIAKWLGAQVQRAPLPDELSGLLYRENADDQPIIGVNSLHPKVRQRFTVAHEIAHMCLHHATNIHIDRGFSLRFRNKTSTEAADISEIEANQFAAELLMPERFIREDLGQRTADLADEELLTDLASRYQVSLQAMVYRLMNLGYLVSS